MKLGQRRSAFTLVELLVVIGIIALLISILLPSLNRARQFANSIKCSSNQRSIGQLFAMYAAQNKGYFPRSSGTYDATNQWQDPNSTDPQAFPNPQNDQYGTLGPAAYWYDFISLTANPKRTLQSVAGSTGAGTGVYAKYTNLANCGNMAADVLPVFRDTDLSVTSFEPRVTNYFVNMRVIAPMNARDRAVSASGNDGLNRYLPQRPQGSIKNGARVMMMWCGPTATDATGLGIIFHYDCASWNLDGACYRAGGSHYYLDTLQSWSGAPTDASIFDKKIGISGDTTQWSGGTAVTKTFLKSQNVDGGVITNNMRFRHLGNQSMNALFVDGHVESRQLGDVYVRDIVLNRFKY